MRQFAPAGAMETTVEVVEQSQVGQVRRLAVELGRAQGFAEADLGRAAIVATELSTNLVKYAQRGSVTLSRFTDQGSAGIQLIAVDQGPGFGDFLLSSRDGHSTGSTLGIGLGAVMRASDLFDAYTPPGRGSAILSRLARGRALPAPTRARLALGARRAAMRGQLECGDSWAHASSGPWDRLLLVDGLGHGPLAAVAAAAAVAAFQAAAPGDTPQDIIDRCHAALAPTRGAVMAVAAIDVAGGRLLFAGVGNVAAVLHSGGSSQSLLSTEGVVGHRIRKVRLAEHAWSPGDTLVLGSDGLSGRWNLAGYPELLQRHVLLVASVLFRDHARSNDDATLVVARDLQ